MKKGIKKLAALMLVLFMAIGTVMPVFAEQEGSITITNAIPGQTYSVYKILDLEYSLKDNAYTYTAADSKWNIFINSDGIKGVYVSIYDGNHVKWIADDEASTKQIFTQKALEFAVNNGISATKTGKADVATNDDGTANLTIGDLELGYYLVDSTVGTYCSIDTTNPNMQITDKNKAPSFVKEVLEDSTGEYGETNTAQIGENVQYKVTITVVDGAQGYTLHDKMSEGLEFNNDSIVVTSSNEEVTVTKADYSLSENTSDGCTFELEFTNDFCKKHVSGDTITITYSARVTKDAAVDNNPATNEGYLKYGENRNVESNHDDTKTYVYKFQIIKTNDSATDGKYNILTGAKFELYTVKTDGTPINFIDNGNGVYRVADINETGTTTEIEAGTAILTGLDGEKDYYLQETKAPDGYNRLEERQRVNLSSVDNVSNGISIDKMTYNATSGGIQVQNSKGERLPSTGGMGTMILYVAGGILVVAAGVSLVVMKRRKNEENC